MAAVRHQCHQLGGIQGVTADKIGLEPKKEAWQPLEAVEVPFLEEGTMYMVAPCMRGWRVKAVTGRALLGRVGQKGSGAQSLSFHALIPSRPMAVHMDWATDNGVALVECDYLMGSDHRERLNSFLCDAR